MIALPLLLKSIYNLSYQGSKFHITFKNMDDVDSFLRGLGLEELVEGQPSGRDIAYDFVTDREAQRAHDPNREEHLFYSLTKLFQQYCFGSG